MPFTRSNAFFAGIDRPERIRHEHFDLHTGAADERRPAVVFVHGGPVPRDAVTTLRDSAVFTGYAALAASTGLAGVTFDHRLHDMMDLPLSAEDTARVVDRVRDLDQVDPHRIVLWFFSGGGGLAADWLRAAPSWLRGIVWTYPVLAPPPDWPGDRERFDAVSAITAADDLPKLLVRVSGEYPMFRPTQDAAVAAARSSASRLDVINLADADHGYETHGYEPEARSATERAMAWVAGTVGHGD